MLEMTFPLVISTKRSEWRDSLVISSEVERSRFLHCSLDSSLDYARDDMARNDSGAVGMTSEGRSG